jgi:hypothetical protein
MLPSRLADPNPTVAGRISDEMTQMVKLDIAMLEQAAAGQLRCACVA